MIKQQTNRKFIILLSLIVAVGAVFVSFKKNSSDFEIPVSSTLSTASSLIQDVTPVAPRATPFLEDTPTVVIGQTSVIVDIARTNAQIEKGLSGRLSLPAQSGLLFLFSKPDIYQFWMPDMNFPIDIIWINDNKIVDISSNVPNTFNPEAPIFYKSKQPIQYVLEVNAGFTENKHIKIGDAVILKGI